MTETQAPRPNLLVIQVDEMRYPMHFPKGVADAGQFLARFMPNLHKLWQGGVKFSKFYTAAADCTPARATSVTGLYAYQTYMMVTRANSARSMAPSQSQPELQTAFPTYGRLLREAGYDTPYVGKWHLSNCPNPNTATDEEKAAYLNDYGFQGYTLPDPLGLPGAGVGEIDYQNGGPPIIHQHDDAEIAGQALAWLRDRADSGSDKPFCLSVNFVNPHDKQFFWGGTEGQIFQKVYEEGGYDSTSSYGNTPSEANPDRCGYELPDNWQSEADMSAAVDAGEQPKLQMVFRKIWDKVVGQISDAPDETGFSLTDTPYGDDVKAAVAPFHYWTRALDLYTSAMGDVDRQIGLVINNIPERLREDTIVVFFSDHGDYASSHGLQGKGGTVYEECFRVPLIVHDPSGRFTAETDRVRTQFASSVDLLPLLVSLGWNGSRKWLLEDDNFRQLYGRRLDLLPILKNPDAPGREYAVFSTDEYIPAAYNYLHCAQHVLGMATTGGKTGVYTRWRPNTAELITEAGMETEYFDYATEAGRLEMENSAGSPEAQKALDFLLNQAYPQELHAPLPAAYQDAQQTACQELLQYLAQADIESILAN